MQNYVWFRPFRIVLYSSIQIKDTVNNDMMRQWNFKIICMYEKFYLTVNEVIKMYLFSSTCEWSKSQLILPLAWIDWKLYHELNIKLYTLVVPSAVSKCTLQSYRAYRSDNSMNVISHIIRWRPIRDNKYLEDWGAFVVFSTLPINTVECAQCTIYRHLIV